MRQQQRSIASQLSAAVGTIQNFNSALDAFTRGQAGAAEWARWVAETYAAGVSGKEGRKLARVGLMNHLSAIGAWAHAVGARSAKDKGIDVAKATFILAIEKGVERLLPLTAAKPSDNVGKSDQGQGDEGKGDEGKGKKNSPKPLPQEGDKTVAVQLAAALASLQQVALEDEASARIMDAISDCQVLLAKLVA